MRFRLFVIVLALCAASLASCDFAETPDPLEYSVAWQPNSDLLAVSGAELALYRVNGASMQTVVTLEKKTYPPHIYAIAWSPDGKRLVEASDQLQIWDVAAQSSVNFAHLQNVGTVAWSPDGTKLAVGAARGMVQIWDVNTAKLLLTFNDQAQQINALAWSSDGSKLASGDGVYDGGLYVRDAQTGANLASLKFPKAPIDSIDWRPNSDEIAIGGSDQNIRIWNIDHPAPDLVFQGAQDPFWINNLAWSPDGKLLASASSDTLTTWDAETGQHIRGFQGHTGAIESISWKSDGSEIASVSTDHTLRIWDADTGEALVVYPLS